MNLLTIAQLLLESNAIIGRATHPNYTGDMIKDFRKNLEDVAEFCKKSHEAQLDAQKKIEEQKTSQENSNAAS